MSDEMRNEILRLIMEGRASCFACVFCEAPTYERATMGYCRKGPPMQHPDLTRGEWPGVRKGDWCGEFTPIAAIPFRTEG